MTLKNAMLSFLLLIALCISTWSILISEKSKPVRAEIDNSLPDAVMEDVVTLIFNKEGTPSLKITTPKMIHYTSHDVTEIEKPVVTIYRRSPNPWYISSDYAKATQGTTQIEFMNHVLIHHVADKDNPTTMMQTSSLTVFPNKQTAQTDQAVVIKQPDTTVHAIGMLADMNNGTVKLLSQAQGEYVPAS